MKNIKKIIAIAVAAAIMSPMAALANNTPDNVGDVTLLGNIVANSPMWQWTVNDYQGLRLDAKPSEATKEGDVITYKLDGKPFIAVSGYLPSMVGINTITASNLGTRDITAFKDGDGSSIANITNTTEPMAVTFTIKATSFNSAGEAVTGTLKLKSTELRGQRYAFRTGPNAHKRLEIYAGSNSQTPVSGGSCFTGYNGIPLTITGTSDVPEISGVSATVATAFLNALEEGARVGSAPEYSGIPISGNGIDNSSTYPASCGTPTLSYSSVRPLTDVSFLTAAHVTELTPLELSFNTPVQGVWNAILNVTAYQM